MITRLLIVFLGLGLFSCISTPTPPPDPMEEVRFIGRTQVSFLNREATLLQLEVRSEDLSSQRTVEVRIMKPSIPSKGALVLSSGGFGTNFYGIGLETNTTLDFALNLGLETFEIRWQGSEGWGTGIAGAGYPKAVRAYGVILRYLKDSEMAKPDNIIAHGGSGGSFQIAYGLSRFALENDIQHAILVAGPPTADLPKGIFGDKNGDAFWPDGLGGFRITDYIHGWDGNGNYCQNRNQTPPQFVLDALDESSLLSTRVPPELDYSTNLIFINTNDVTNADGQGRLFFDAVKSKKEWLFLPEETSHDVAGIPAGAQKIRQVLQEIL